MSAPSVTVFDALAAAFVVALSAGPAVCKDVVEADEREMAESDAEFVNVYWDSAQMTRRSADRKSVGWAAKMYVKCQARSKTVPGTKAVSPLVGRVYARLAADPTIGGLTPDIGEPTFQCDYSNQAQRLGCTVLAYTVVAQTKNSVVT